MRRNLLFLSVLLLASAGAAETGAVLAGHPFSADFTPGGRLRLRVRSGEVRILGTDQSRISVEVSGRKAAEARDIRVRLKEKSGSSELRISGGPRNDITLTIRIPRKTDLYARIPFGEVHVEGVEGDKDIELHAGDLTVAVGPPAGYGHVDASVTTGEIDAEPFGESHGGLFRSFRIDGTGRYRLHAHVGAGQLTLQ